MELIAQLENIGYQIDEILELIRLLHKAADLTESIDAENPSINQILNIRKFNASLQNMALRANTRYSALAETHSALKEIKQNFPEYM